MFFGGQPVPNLLCPFLCPATSPWLAAAATCGYLAAGCPRAAGATRCVPWSHHFPWIGGFRAWSMGQRSRVFSSAPHPPRHGCFKALSQASRQSGYRWILISKVPRASTKYLPMDITKSFGPVQARSTRDLPSKSWLAIALFCLTDIDCYENRLVMTPRHGCWCSQNAGFPASRLFIRLPNGKTTLINLRLQAQQVPRWCRQIISNGLVSFDAPHDMRHDRR